ncbi:MAG: thrombospondin type 3 repeat-containing protein, partial [Verrucomicrobiota bacterium]
DPDGDRFTNAQEFSLGTDPMDPSSSFKTGAMSRDGNSVTISWSSVSGKTYQVQKRASLTSGSWVDVGGPITATSGSSSATVDVSDAPNACFLRIKHGP